MSILQSDKFYKYFKGDVFIVTNENCSFFLGAI
jgi:hypothetical protein